MKDYIREILEEVNNIQVRYTKPLLERNYTDRDYAIGSYEKLVYKMIDIINNLQKENDRLNNIINTFEEEIELELTIDEKDTLLEHNTFITINDVLQKVLKRIKELKEGK